MHWDSKILVNYLREERPPILSGQKSPLKERPPNYKARFQMYWNSKILINNPPQERPPILSGQISNALR